MDEIKTKKQPSWSIYLLLSLLAAGVVSIVFGNMSVQQINDELYMTQLVERQQYIPFYKWFNGTIEVQNPRLDEPIAELNNHTLREVFEDGNLFINDVSELYASPNTFNIVDGVITFTFSNELKPEGQEYLRTLNPLITNQDDVYVTYTLKSDKALANNRYWVGNNFPYLAQYTNEYVRYSDIATSVSSSNFGFFTNANDTMVLGDKVYIKNIYVGLSLGLSKEEMDYWFNVYHELRNYTSIPIYDVGAYGVTPEQIEYYYNKYLNYVETMGLQDVYLVYTNPEYNTQLGNTFVVQYQNVTKSILDTIDNLKGVYDGFKNTLDKIGDFFS